MSQLYKASQFLPPQVTVPSQRPDYSVSGHRCFVVATTSTVTDLGTDWVGRYITFDAEVTNVRVIFGSTSGIAAAAGTDGGGVLLYAGAPQSWLIQQGSRYMATIAAATTSLHGYVSSPE